MGLFKKAEQVMKGVRRSKNREDVYEALNEHLGYGYDFSSDEEMFERGLEILNYFNSDEFNEDEHLNMIWDFELDYYEDDDYIPSLSEERLMTMPEGCRACGGPYPSCTTSCKLFDD